MSELLAIIGATTLGSGLVSSALLFQSGALPRKAYTFDQFTDELVREIVGEVPEEDYHLIERVIGESEVPIEARRPRRLVVPGTLYRDVLIDNLATGADISFFGASIIPEGRELPLIERPFDYSPPALLSRREEDTRLRITDRINLSVVTGEVLVAGDSSLAAMRYLRLRQSQSLGWPHRPYTKEHVDEVVEFFAESGRGR